MSRNPPRPTIGFPVPAGQTSAGNQAVAPASPLMKAYEAFQSGNLRRAEKFCKDALKLNSGNLDALHLLGVIAFQQGNAEASAIHLGKVIEGGSQNPDHMANYARALSACARLTEAETMFGRALELKPDDGGGWNDYGNTLFKAGKLSEAEEAYRRSLDLAPGNPKAYVNLVQLLLAQGRNAEALETSRKAVSISPELSVVRNTLGTALAAAGDTEGAIEAYEKASDLDGKAIEPVTNLASLYEEINDTDMARRTAGRALKLDKRNPHALLVLAKCYRRDNDLEAAIKDLSRVNKKSLPAPLHRDIAFEQSRLYDRLDRTAEAFDAMTEGNAQALVAEGVDETLGDQFLDTIKSLKEWVGPETAKMLSTTVEIDDGNSDPIFLVGFPRSGTTLLGLVLDSHSGLVMVEERPMLDQLVATIRNDFGGYPAGIASLNTNDIDGLRRQYFQSVDDECERNPHQRIVDKFPLHLIHAGLIRAVFPKAQYILALRHPCDVVLSCFMQNFRPNPAMANFFSVERGAMTYDRVMDLWAAYEEHLHPDAHAIRYENVVTDFDTEISTLLDFLDIKWEDGVRDFAERARNRGKIDTPSYAQVTEDLYTRARYRWLRYENQMQPAMDDLNPWIEHFDYAGIES